MLTQAAPSSGWASFAGGTRGGAAATTRSVFLVSSAAQLRSALTAQPGTPTIIKVNGMIDMAAGENGGPFTSASDQSKRGQISLPSNTTLIGASTDAGFKNAQILVKRVNNVVIRNLKIINPCDINPIWDSGDGGGNWNSAYDGINIDGSTHVWVDHNTFTDAPMTDDKAALENGKLKQCHDGSLDVKNGANYVTVSNNLFQLHDKNVLVGSDDDKLTDDGFLKVTFLGNHFQNVSSRSPRARFGQIHIYNNYFEGNRDSGVYRHHYSVGVGFKAKIISQNNVFDVVGAADCGAIVRNPGKDYRIGAMRDTGSMLNGRALGLGSPSCKFSETVGWSVPYTPVVMAADQVRASVLRNAGSGKLTVR